ncbi:MAG: TetR/AcrR family transcriptional regulator [Desulfobacteraceae bacterium]|nr:TetR/AcrR family transcriptional regulator [Desulfobacteraceae bacterium]
MKRKESTKAEQTRRFIIEKAAPVFNKKGVAGTSLADLTRATGLTKGSIYGNFKDKDEVAVSVFQYNVDNLINSLFKEMDTETSSVESLLALPRAYRKRYRQIIAYGGCPILNTATEADDTHEALCELTVEAIARLKEKIVSLVELGMAGKEIAGDTDANAIANVTIALIEGGSILAKVTREDSYMIDALEQIETLIRSRKTVK